MIAFTWVCKLDKKFRLVIPEKARRELQISDKVLLELSDYELVVKKANGESGNLISRNCMKVDK